MSIKIGLVTVLFKSDEMLYDFFKSISIQDYKNYLLIIVDNSPSESTKIKIDELNKIFNIPFVHLEMKNNIGVAAANNVGIKFAFENYCSDIIILNNDISFHQTNCFSTLVSLSNTNQIIVPKIYYYNTNKVWYAGGLMRRWFGFVKHIGIDKLDAPEYNKSTFTEYAPTCFVYVKKSVFDKIGLMDEKYFVYVDDTDFMHRAITNNFKIKYEPTLVIEHKVSQSTGGLKTDFSFYYDTRNKIYFSRKFNNFFLAISSNLFVIFLSFVFAIKEQRVSAIKNVFNAIVDGYKMKVEKVN